MNRTAPEKTCRLYYKLGVFLPANAGFFAMTPRLNRATGVPSIPQALKTIVSVVRNRSTVGIGGWYDPGQTDAL